jgi:hypothetical protein
VYVAPLGLWLTLDAGQFQAVEIAGDDVRVTLAPATPFTPAARLRIEQPAAVDGVGTFRPDDPAFATERGAHIIPLGADPTSFRLRPAPRLPLPLPSSVARFSNAAGSGRSDGHTQGSTR